MTILEKYLKNHPNRKTIEICGKRYPVNKTNDDILCVKDAGLIDYCPICRNCWNLDESELKESMKL